VIENNPNKNLIVSMSIKQEFTQQKKKKRKRDPKIHVNSNEGSLKELKHCFKVFLYFLSIEIPYYKEQRVDKIKIIKSSDFKSLSNHPQIETFSQTLSDLDQTMSGPTRESPIHSQSPSRTISSSPPDFVRILNIGLTTRFLRELYINTSTSNGSPLLPFEISC
jgi:hypothetical protein